MKIIKWGFGALSLLIVAFFLVGVFVPAFTYESQVTVNRPAAHAFAVFMDESKTAQWMTGFKSFELISGNQNDVGSKYKMVVEENGELMEMEETVTAFQENELFAFKLVNDVMFMESEVRFAENNGQTTITGTNLVEGRNLIWKSLLALFKGNMGRRSQEMYDNLKQVIESTELSTESNGDKAEARMSVEGASK